jgi:hypothetical protein
MSDDDNGPAAAFWRWNGLSLADLLQLEPTSSDCYRSRCNEPNLYSEIFGGQFPGQALQAALLTGDGRAPHASSTAGWRQIEALQKLESSKRRQAIGWR